MHAIHRVIHALSVWRAGHWGLDMRGIVHPLAEELGGLVEIDKQDQSETVEEHDTSWRWMFGIAVAIGLLAWFTR